MTALTVLPDRLTALSVADLVALPATQLAEIVRNLDELLGWHKQQRAKVDAALDRSYAERIQSARADAGKDFGTVHIDDSGIRITVDVPKRVSWDQTKLAAIAQRIAAAGEKVEDFIDVDYAVSESRFNNWPPTLRDQFAAARTVKPGDAAGEFVGSQKRFSDLLITRGVEKWRNTVGLRGFRGIGLKSPPTPAYTPYADH